MVYLIFLFLLIKAEEEGFEEVPIENQSEETFEEDDEEEEKK